MLIPLVIPKLLPKANTTPLSSLITNWFNSPRCLSGAGLPPCYLAITSKESPIPKTPLPRAESRCMTAGEPYGKPVSRPVAALEHTATASRLCQLPGSAPGAFRSVHGTPQSPSIRCRHLLRRGAGEARRESAQSLGSPWRP